MTAYLGVLTLVTMIVLVLVRIRVLSGRGVTAMKFGATNKSDFLIPPFALLYLYLVCANAFEWPAPAHLSIDRVWLEWVGVASCAIAVGGMIASLISFGTSFRVGIDTEKPDKLITTGIFAFSRNPIYVAFGFMLVGQFLIGPQWILLIYVVVGFALFHRQVLREEVFLREHYGAEYEAYSRKVWRYL